jgi:hypothetical protein
MVRWHLWAILGMVGLNYLILVHVPTLTNFFWGSEPSNYTESLHWEPEVWEGSTEAHAVNWQNIEAEMATDLRLVSRQSHGDSDLIAPVDVDPVPINLHQIRRRIQIPHDLLPKNGTVRIRANVLVDENGDYLKHRMPDHALPALATAVENHISGLSFLPALRDGKPVPYWVEVSFVFEL